MKMGNRNEKMSQNTLKLRCFEKTKLFFLKPVRRAFQNFKTRILI